MDFATAQAARDKLFDDIFYGRMRPDEAEAEAARQGLEPLQPKPDVSCFDPMAEATWTLAMAVAWIVWRTPEEVRQNWDDYLRECCHWVWAIRRLPMDGGREWEIAEGWELQHSQPATLDRLSFEEIYHDVLGAEGRKLVSVKTAREDLWGRLAEGTLVATAVQAGTECPVQIPAHEWPYLTATINNSADELRYKRARSGRYRDVTFLQANVCAIWKPETAKKQTIAGERGCQQWLESEMRQSPNLRPKVKRAYMDDAIMRFGVSENGFRRAWSNAVTTTGATAWSRAGAPKKSSR